MSEREPTNQLADELARARPESDDAAADAMFARLVPTLFSGAPAQLGRFVLRGPLAGGGMGMIHRALDPKLGRPVALKLLHPRRSHAPQARARLIAEARVLARLSHPNVVPVYEVDEIDGQVIVVMELVEGKTLAEWGREHHARWRDIANIYAQAGRGLAAAHELGIVHRDFKPSNAIVGDDGRVRVLDFGLARLSDGGDAPVAEFAAATAFALSAVTVSETVAFAEADTVTATDSGAEIIAETDTAQLAVVRLAGARASPAGAPRLTLTGEVLGTLAYMSPEQLSGGTATAASDQFSFCVSLFRALYGVAPFRGCDAASLHASISVGQFSPVPGSGVPVWLRAALCRGLAARPDDRHPSMRALIDELERERGWRRWRWAVAAGAMIALAAALVVLIARGTHDHAADPLAACDRAVVEASRVWNTAANHRIGDAFARIDTPYARVIGSRITNALDLYRDRWSAQRNAACVDYRAVRLSADRFDRRMQCLDRRLQDLASTIDVLGKLDAASVTSAVDAAVRLPAIEPCTENDSADDAAPDSSIDRIQLAAARGDISRAEALLRAGRTRDASSAADRAVEQARRLGEPTTFVEATLVRGWILVRSYEFQDAIGPLRAAEQLALERHQVRLAVIAGARRIYAESMANHELHRIAGHVELLEPLSRSLGGGANSSSGDHFARPLLLNYLGVFDMVRGDRASARRHFEAARAELAGVTTPDPELIDIDMNLAMLTEDRFAREALARSTWQRYRDLLGAEHLTVLTEQCRYAHYVADPVAALQVAREAGELYRRYHGDRRLGRAVCALYRAFLAGDVGAPDEAGVAFAEVAELAVGTTDRELAVRGSLARGHLARLSARTSEALVEFRMVSDQLATSLDWWDQEIAAEGQLGTGLVEEALAAAAPNRPGRATHLARAAEAFDHAAATLANVAQHNEDREPRQRLAVARLALARVLRVRGTDHSRARALAAQAAAFYREANPAAYRAQLETLR